MKENRMVNKEFYIKQKYPSNEDEINTVSEKQRLRDLFSSIPSLWEMLYLKWKQINLRRSK